MKILVLGMDGYLGWGITNYFADSKHELYGVDNFARRKWVKEMGSVSALPIPSMKDRVKKYQKAYDKEITFYKGDITDYAFLSDVVNEVTPDVVIHFAQCPSAPYSMISQEKTVAVQSNNLAGTLNIIYAVKEFAPNAHIVKLGTMGEYGTPNIDIAEGFFDIEYKGRKDRLPFPRQANSWYHLSKVHDSNNLQFACRNYGVRCTDIMQGVVFGFLPGDEKQQKKLNTRLDFDQAFGTIINRFCCEAIIHHGITVYGDGTQTRSFLPLRDSMKCFELVINNPPAAGEYRVVNQFANVWSARHLAEKVKAICSELAIEVEIEHITNPRKEAERHYYNPENENLKKLGYVPVTDFDQEIRQLIEGIQPYRKRIKEYSSVLKPTIRW